MFFNLGNCFFLFLCFSQQNEWFFQFFFLEGGEVSFVYKACLRVLQGRRPPSVQSPRARLQQQRQSGSPSKPVQPEKVVVSSQKTSGLRAFQDLDVRMEDAKPDGGVVAGDTFQQVAKDAEEATAPFQYAFRTRAGTECVPHIMQTLTDLDPRTTILSVDG